MTDERSAGLLPAYPLPAQNETQAWPGLDYRGSAITCFDIARRWQGLTVCITSDSHSAAALDRELQFYCQDSSIPVLHFPDWETLPYDVFSPHPEIISDRVKALYQMPDLSEGLIVMPIATLLQRLAPRQYIRGQGLVLKQGQTLNLDEWRLRLESRGYRCVPQVMDPGDFAVRGAVLDIFPMGAREPYRVELFDDEVESLRTFDPDSQLSTGQVTNINLLPGREFPFDDKAIAYFRKRFRDRFLLDVSKCPLYQDARRGVAGPGLEYYLPLFFEKTNSLFEYLPEDCLLVDVHGVSGPADTFLKQVESRHEQRRHDIERPLLSPQEIFLSREEVAEAMSMRPAVIFTDKQSDAISAPGASAENRGPVETALRELQARPGRKLIVCDSPGRREAMLEELQRASIGVQQIASWRAFETSDVALALTVGQVEHGWSAGELTIITERELRGAPPAGRTRRRGTKDPQAIIKNLHDLETGAPVVHEDHGVGRYQGLQHLDVGEVTTEFLVIEYADSDRLYVPVASLHLVSRYTGSDLDSAPLHRLGSDQWQKAKRKAAEKIRDVAAELLELYAKREARQGHAFELDDRLYEQFAAGFPFQTTPDQQQAIDHVIQDLLSDQPMDRVVCGDVGFGKTEVALRAAFVVAQAGRQTALLVPTTLLAQQHFRNFCDRFADWPIRVEVLSRFRSAKEVKSILQDVEAGQVDILIGTHRLLQRDIKFGSLGLVIVDEEQRFGVRQKERLKSLRAEVDLLTLTATPIPRTLNMAMGGLRDLSIIATPPPNRLSVSTIIGEWDASTIREALQRELQRGGQAFFLHNEVKTIQRIADELAQIMPQARMRVAHGQMPEQELERVMLDFVQQRFNVLVCSTIIENGIDIPSANTIIINRADRLGLAQLHQLRGRVGRSHHRAFAYLLVPHPKAMTSDARKRLEALSSLEELGAGFTLATHDLEIRGAGELLGDEQTGQIEAIGFTLYMDLLDRAIASLREGGELDLDASAVSGAEVELHIPALIPDTYLPDIHARLTLYKRIASAVDAAELKELKVEMIDRFGLLPDPVNNLFKQTELRLFATELGIKRLDLSAQGGRIEFVEQPNVAPDTILGLIQAQPQTYGFEGAQTLRIRQELPENEQRLETAYNLVTTLGGKRAA